MELEKVTDSVPRRYNDACGAAHALELVGERWALLILRELILGPRRFGDLRASLPGLSANVLTQRLEGLEAAGVVRRGRLPPPASVPVYELTDWGAEIRPVFAVLGRWAARSPRHDPTLPLSPTSLMLSFETMFDADRAGAEPLSALFVFDQARYAVRIADGRIDVGRARDGEAADFTLTAAGPPVVAAWVYGAAPLEALADQASLTGDRTQAERFRTLHIDLACPRAR